MQSVRHKSIYSDHVTRKFTEIVCLPAKAHCVWLIISDNMLNLDALQLMENQKYVYWPEQIYSATLRMWHCVYNLNLALDVWFKRDCG